MSSHRWMLVMVAVAVLVTVAAQSSFAQDPTDPRAWGPGGAYAPRPGYQPAPMPYIYPGMQYPPPGYPGMMYSPPAEPRGLSPWAVVGIILIVVLVIGILAYGLSVGWGWLGYWIRLMRGQNEVAERANRDIDRNARTANALNGRVGRGIGFVPPLLGPTAGRVQRVEYDEMGRIVGAEEYSFPYTGPAPANPVLGEPAPEPDPEAAAAAA